MLSMLFKILLNLFVITLVSWHWCEKTPAVDSTDPTIFVPSDMEIEPVVSPSAIPSPLSPSKQKADRVKSNLPQIQFWLEAISPALKEGSTYTPNSDGSSSSSLSGLINTASITYKTSPHMSLLLTQKTNLSLAGDPTQTLRLTPKNPKFGLRFTNLFKIPQLKVNHDFYIQPAWIVDSGPSYRKSFDLGLKNSAKIIFKNSRWSLWATFELTGSFYSYNNQQAAERYSGSFQPAIKYRIYPESVGYPLCTTHHGFNFSFFESPNHKILYDNTGPFMQNGIGVVFSKTTYLSALINNYILVAPTLQNTWLTVGFNITAL